jgi:hypothetical protein
MFSKYFNEYSLKGALTMISHNNLFLALEAASGRLSFEGPFGRIF